MASPTIDSTATLIDKTNGTSTSWTHTCAAGATLLMVGWVGNYALDTYTYDGNALTLHDTVTHSVDRVTQWLYIENPSAGANTVALAWTGNSWRFGMSISLSNADTPRAATTATSTGTDVGATCTSVVGDMVIDMVEYGKATSGTRTASVDGGQTQVLNSGGSAGAYANALGSYKVAVDTTTLMGWTLANSDIWGSIAAAVPYVSSFTPTATTIF